MVVVPDFEPALLITHPGVVCSVIAFVVCMFTPSMMSISPELGQLGPKSQKAGQEPQVLEGICAMSATKRPWVYDFLEVRRTEARPEGETLVWSTCIFTWELAVEIRFADWAADLERYFTKPWVGSSPVKKEKELKKLAELYVSLRRYEEAAVARLVRLWTS